MDSRAWGMFCLNQDEFYTHAILDKGKKKGLGVCNLGNCENFGAVAGINSTFESAEMIDAVAETQSGNATALESSLLRGTFS